jgi:indolepyruvate decarboxylase
MKHYVDGTKIFNTVADAKTTADYVVARLVDLGIMHSFTVPGDFAFAIDHALINNSRLKNINSANELNASYASDGYAREKGAAILCTTYAVGELSALNGVMGAKAENNIIFHLVGAPASALAINHKQAHHTLGDGVYGQFNSISSSATCVSAVITPDNAVSEMNRVIRDAFKFRQPAYISIALDSSKMPVTDTTSATNNVKLVSQAANLDKAVDFIVSQIETAQSVVIIPSLKLDRYGLTATAISLIERLNVPFVIMPHDKSVIDETHPNYLGFYAGALSDKEAALIVEQADLVLDLGQVLWSDFNTSGYTNHIDLAKTLTLAPLFVKQGKKYFSEIFLADVLDKLLSKVQPKNYRPDIKKTQFKSITIDDSSLKLDSFYNQFVGFLSHNDVLVIETGSASLNMPRLPIPSGVKYHNQTLWGSIGWATPAVLGVALASPDKRAILVTGEGSHQLTLNELGVMGRYGINPIIICINNDGYMVERALEPDPNHEYDDVAQLQYAQLPEVFGCKNWLTFKVKTNLELNAALEAARLHKSGVYIEIITGRLDFGATLEFFNHHLSSMYS